MKTYLVQWSIDIEAETPREAAEKAREIQLDPESFATHFSVRVSKNLDLYINVDLKDEEE